MLVKWPGLILLAFVSIFVSSCTKDQSANTNCTTCPVISFKSDIIPIFLANCSYTGCHTGVPDSANGKLVLDSAVAYAQITVPGVGIVNPGNTTTSVLLSLLYPNGKPHMPIVGQLAPCDIQKVYCWISEGALNN